MFHLLDSNFGVTIRLMMMSGRQFMNNVVLTTPGFELVAELGTTIGSDAFGFAMIEEPIFEYCDDSFGVQFSEWLAHGPSRIAIGEDKVFGTFLFS